jgi:hypothetical protein
MILQDYNYWFVEANEIRPKNRLDSCRFGGGKGGGSVKAMPKTQAATMAAKAPTSEMNEAEQQNKRLAASALTKEWDGMTLGKKSLLGG